MRKAGVNWPLLTFWEIVDAEDKDLNTATESRDQVVQIEFCLSRKIVKFEYLKV